MTSIAPVASDTKNLYKDFTVQSPKPSINTSKNTLSSDTFEKKTEKRPFLIRAKDYLFAPVDNPNYNKDRNGQSPTTTRFKQFCGYAFIAAIYGGLFFYMFKNLRATGVELKPEGINAFMDKYKENLAKAPRLKDLALPDVLEKTVERLMNKIKDPESFIQKGGTNKNTILLYGPPGTGKTTVARAIAKEIENAELFSVDLSTIQGKYVGESEANLDKIIRSVCKYAKENPFKKVVVLMDEFDSVAIKDNGSSNQQYHASLLNVLKRAISEKLTQHDNIILIATTNAELDKAKAKSTGWVQTLDAAIADRFGEQIRVDNPTKGQFVKAIVHHYKDLKQVDDCLRNEGSREVEKIAQRLSDNDCSFRTLENLYNASAATSKGEKLSVNDVLSALDTCIEASKKEAGKQVKVAGFAG